MSWGRVLLISALIVASVKLGNASEKDADHRESGATRVGINSEKLHDEGHEHGEEGAKEHGKEHEDEHGEERELPSGITSYSDETGTFALSSEAVRNYGITVSTFSMQNGVLTVPQTALVGSLKASYLYFLDQHGYTSYEVDVLKTEGGRSTVKAPHKVNGSSVVVSGMNFLKTIQLSLEEDPSEGHGH